jgi:hypothetical protein
LRKELGWKSGDPLVSLLIFWGLCLRCKNDPSVYIYQFGVFACAWWYCVEFVQGTTPACSLFLGYLTYWYTSTQSFATDGHLIVNYRWDLLSFCLSVQPFTPYHCSTTAAWGWLRPAYATSQLFWPLCAL